jgi:protein TonB
MSRTLFDAPPPETRRAARSSTVIGSVIAHGAVFGLLVAWQFGAIESPAVARGLEVFVAPRDLPVPPPPPTPAPVTPRAPVADPSVAPIAAPDRIEAESPVTPSPESGVPGAIAVGAGGAPWSAGNGSNAALAPPPPSQPVPPPAILKIGGNIKAPARLSYTAPVYPAIAQAAKVQGIVELEATIDERGVVRNVKVVRSVPLLDQAAIAAVSTWRYTPTQLNGVAVPVVMTVRVAFSLN